MSADDVHPNGTDTIVLIHGLWVTALIWEHWVERYRARGYRVLAPDWPGLGPGIAELRRDPSAIAGLGVTEIADHYAHLVGELHPPPALVGHCLGGLVVQVLLDRGLGAVGVAINPVPPSGAKHRSFMLMAGFPALRNSSQHRQAIALTPRQFHRAFASTLSYQQATAVHARHNIPAPASVVRPSCFTDLARPDLRNRARAPLLLIGGGRDQIFPASRTRSTFRRYRKSNAVTGYQEYPGRSHYTIGEPGWEYVADYALRWAMDHARHDP